MANHSPAASGTSAAGIDRAARLPRLQHDAHETNAKVNEFDGRDLMRIHAADASRSRDASKYPPPEATEVRKESPTRRTPDLARGIEGCGPEMWNAAVSERWREFLRSFSGARAEEMPTRAAGASRLHQTLSRRDGDRLRGPSMKRRRHMRR